MKNLTTAALLLAIVFGSFASSFGTAQAVDYSYCPGGGQVNGWWGTISPSTRVCLTTYYTWNTLSLATEESWFFSNATYASCNKATPPTGPTYYNSLGTSAYIPSPDSSQTSSAHYYRWGSATNWSLLGTVDQYNTFGWIGLSANSWHALDKLKMTDYTNEGTIYSKHVDLDGFKFTNCPS